jgi:excisionase family DNA binding protein
LNHHGSALQGWGSGAVVEKLENILTRLGNNIANAGERIGLASVSTRYDPEPELLTMRELCVLLNCSVPTVHRLLAAKQLPAFKVGNRWRFRRSQVNEWMEREGKRPHAVGRKWR